MPDMENAMIAKHINFKKTVRSSLRRLVEYITSAKQMAHRIGEIILTNCRQDDPELASLEMQLTQAQNHRAKSDKTYHLLVSFRAGEDPTPQILKRVEATMCAKLGFAEHQRIAVVHHDTDNVHLHIAINKIHPRKFTIHTPRRDFRTLAKTCVALEEECLLKHDNHVPTGRTQGERDARDMEAMSGQESLLTWVRRECLPAMRQAKNWEELHTTLAKAGLTIALRGNGVIIASSCGARIKGSDVDPGRAFSKANLEKRFGPFVTRSKECARIQPEKVYQKKPLGKESPLHQEFSQSRDSRRQVKDVALAAINQEYRKRTELIRAENTQERERIRHLPAGRFQKRDLYHALSEKLRNDMEAARLQAKEERRKLHQQLPGRYWLSWLQEQAMNGRQDALRILRTRAWKLAKKTMSTIGGEHDSPTSLLEKQAVDSITKHGTVIYAVGADALRDEGDAFRLSRNASQETIVMALRIARQRFGEPLRLNGDYSFRDKILRAAVSERMNVRFADPQLETMRQRMMKFNQPSNQHRKENVR